MTSTKAFERAQVAVKASYRRLVRSHFESYCSFLTLCLHMRRRLGDSSNKSFRGQFCRHYQWTEENRNEIVDEEKSSAAPGNFRNNAADDCWRSSVGLDKNQIICDRAYCLIGRVVILLVALLTTGLTIIVGAITKQRKIAHHEIFHNKVTCIEHDVKHSGVFMRVATKVGHETQTIRTERKTSQRRRLHAVELSHSWTIFRRDIRPESASGAGMVWERHNLNPMWTLYRNFFVTEFQLLFSGLGTTTWRILNMIRRYFSSHQTYPWIIWCTHDCFVTSSAVGKHSESIYWALCETQQSLCASGNECRTRNAINTNRWENITTKRTTHSWAFTFANNISSRHRIRISIGCGNAVETSPSQLYMWTTDRNFFVTIDEMPTTMSPSWIYVVVVVRPGDHNA